jgi:hypothetical protein
MRFVSGAAWKPVIGPDGRTKSGDSKLRLHFFIMRFISGYFMPGLRVNPPDDGLILSGRWGYATKIIEDPACISNCLAELGNWLYPWL